MNPAQPHLMLPAGGAYAWLMVAGILVGAFYWRRRYRQSPEMPFVFVGALAGAFAGAKLAYLFAEGWIDWSSPDRWLRLATGKSILGGLLGGYAGTEIAKRLIGHRESTGDALVMILPVSLLLGRIGCALHGCCQGICLDVFSHRPAWLPVRWPAPMVEAGFQVLMLGILLTLRGRPAWKDRLFFFYMTCYGFFRFFHEFLRDTPKVMLGLSGYQWISAAMVVLGAWEFWRRGASRKLLDSPV